MERAGMHWTPQGAQAMLDVRSTYVNGDWEEYQAFRMDRETNRSKGFGFVEMSTDEEAKAAIDSLNGKDLSGRPVALSEARPQAPRENRGGGGGGYGGNSY